jgi:hypothetical protein
MNPAVLLLASLSAFQGQALELAVPDEPGLEAVHAEWGEHRLVLVPDGDAWVAVVAVDLDTAAGAHPLVIERDFGAAGEQREADEVVVSARQFPTTELTVAPGYVELSPENQDRSARESAEINAIYARLTPERYWTEPFQVPIPGATGGTSATGASSTASRAIRIRART